MKSPRHAPGTIQLSIGLTIVAVAVLLSIAPGLVVRENPIEGDLLARFTPIADSRYWLGADHLGRDQLARVVAGLRWSLACAVVSCLIAAFIGIGIGLVAAWRGGWVRTLVDQLVAAVLSFPGLVIAMSVVAAFGRGFVPLVLTLGLLSWPVFARVTLAEAGSLLRREYVLAARVAGASGPYLLIRHVLPGLRRSLVVVAAFHFADLLIAESALSFLGLGAPLGAPTWGNMLGEARAYLFVAPAMVIVPSMAIVLMVCAISLIGDGVDARLAGEQSRRAT